jgi:hypothetical protein
MNRRTFLQVAAAGPVTLPEFHPKSMLHVAETKVPRSRAIRPWRDGPVGYLADEGK